MKLSKVLEKYPGLMNVDLHSDGTMTIPYEASDAIFRDYVDRQESERKVLRIIEHHMQRLNAELDFYTIGEKTFATITSNCAATAVGISIRNPKDDHSDTTGEALAAARAFMNFETNLLNAGRWGITNSIASAVTKVWLIVEKKILN